jgi:hypothetical protein
MLAKRAILWQIVGLVLMICHVMLVRQSLMFYPIVILISGWMYLRSSIGGLIIWFGVLVYQNLIIAFFSTHLEYSEYTALGGTNFVMLVIMAAIACQRLLPLWNTFRPIAIALTLGMALAVCYLLIGATKSGFTPAMFYFRQVTGPLLAAVIGIDVGRAWGFRTVGLCLLYTAIPSLILSVVEFIDPINFYIFFNEVHYYQLKYALQTTQNTFYVPQDIVTHFTAAFFNMTGSDPHDDWNSFRFGGTIINPVSNGYIIAITGLVAVSVKRSYWLILVVPLLLAVGVKGASVLLAGSLLLWLFWRSVHNRKLLLIAGLIGGTLYVAATLYIGLSNQDYHALGFMGGVHSLTSTPIGHGLGVGGNVSDQANAGMHWEGKGGFRSAGVDFALESAVGVMFYQMGFASFVIIGTFVTFLLTAPLGRTRNYVMPTRSDIMFFGLGFIMLNGIFQEEAYAPYAAGLLMLLVGVLVGNQRRQGVLVSMMGNPLRGQFFGGRSWV